MPITAIAGLSPALSSLVDADTAAIVAQHWLERIDPGKTACVAEGRAGPWLPAGAPAFYCFALSPTGYVVVTGDTRLPPVIAYSLESDAGALPDARNPLANLLEWDVSRRLADPRLDHRGDRDAVAAEWRQLLHGPAPRAPAFQQWPPAGSTPTGGWLLSNWTQNAPYNDLCPTDGTTGSRSLAGCPAVAMAQIVHFHARLNAVHFDDADDYFHNYGSTNRYWIDDAYLARSFPSWPQLNTYLETVFDSYFLGTPLTNTSKAALVYACGAAAHQVYSASGSGTFSVSQAFQAFLKFSCTTAELLTEDTPELYTRVKDNMVAALPVHLAVVNDAWTVGHNLVIDGYNTDDYFHLNFGWGGSYNGWYRLLSGLPYSLTVIEGVIVDIMALPCAAMDCNCDGNIDAVDFARAGGCLNGPGTTCTAPGCRSFDADDDDDVDLRDLAVMQTVAEAGVETATLSFR